MISTLKLSKLVEAGRWQGGYWPVKFIRPDDYYSQFVDCRYIDSWRMEGGFFIMHECSNPPAKEGLGPDLLAAIGQYKPSTMPIEVVRKTLAEQGDVECLVELVDGWHLAVKQAEYDGWAGRIVLHTQWTDGRIEIGGAATKFDI